ncbi:poly [ADP-ribose] polymerase 1-like [Babylonia areolata]|uniref:poly [ADP-ribose] polymerase 1-like n=1 Tax=Babylonia areolata TaxID=304850 RepID=UPI003FD54B42
MSDHSDLPFKAEYAKSGRAGCKACKGNIMQNSLRLAIMVQSPMFDGKMPNWHHYACFWKRARPETEDEIHGFHSLRWEDQQKIKEKIAAASGESGDAKGVVNIYNDFVAEYAKSSRSTCRGCDQKIQKDLMRVSKKDYESLRSKMHGPQDQWYHVDCFIGKRDELGFRADLNPEKITGFGKLKKEDKDYLLEKLGKGEAKKRKGGEEKGAGGKKAKKEETEEEKQLKEQSQMIWKYRDALKIDVSNEALRVLLELNGQKIPSGETKLLEAVSDCLVFGALDPCAECKDGQLYYSPEGYKCSGNVTEWTKCMHITKTPKRHAFKVPTEFHDVPFLKSYKYVKRERVFPTITVTAHVGPVSSSVDAVDGPSTSKPLEDLRFVIISKAKAQLTKDIQGLGGVVVSKPDSKTAACISTKEEVDKLGKAMKEVKGAEVEVVPDNFLQKVQQGGAVVADLIKTLNMAPWGGDVDKRIGKRPVKSAPKSGMTKKDEERFTKSVPTKLKMMVKGGAAVDPESGLAETTHVLKDKGDNLYTAVLGLVDITRSTNSFYKLQALEGDSANSYWLFRAWGRVGTTVGGNKVERCGSKDSVIDKFKNLYLDKTGNHWEDRNDFQKKPNKFYPLEIDYGQDDETVKKLSVSGSKSGLPKSVQDLICLIFDVDQMKKAMMEFEIDMKKMPLGKLSKRQIESAYKVLTELQTLVTKKGTKTQFVDATNRFYTLIPHDFGMGNIKLLDTEEAIKTKTEMLDNLLEIEVAYSLLRGGDAGEDPIDAHYKKLKCGLQPVDKKADMYKKMCDYVKNTHAATHQQYTLDVLDIFEVDREGEQQQFEPFKAMHNRQLLWHGSRTTNFAGILSQGLRIAPPEAPVTGYMFGKGIYFADMVSKSANYCRTSKSDPIGILLLCEVALGNMHELTSSSYITKLPKGKHSTKGIGMTTPDPKGFHTTKDGVVIPMGASSKADIPYSSLLYNEYIVYDVAQVKIKYLLKTKFSYKW